MAKVKINTLETVPSLEALNRLANVMLEDGFIPGFETVESTVASVQKNGESWFSNGAQEFKILTDTFGIVRLYNFRFISHKKIDRLFEAIQD